MTKNEVDTAMSEILGRIEDIQSNVYDLISELKTLHNKTENLAAELEDNGIEEEKKDEKE